MIPRTITAPDELDALPTGSVVRTARGDIATRHASALGKRKWLIAGFYGPQVLYPDTDLPVAVLHDPILPAPAVSDAAVKVVADEVKAHYGPLGDTDEGTLCNCGAVVAPVGEYGVRAWREHVAGSVLDAVLPLLGAAPSATREDVEQIARTLAETTALTGADAHLIVQAAEALSGPSATREEIARVVLDLDGPLGVASADTIAESLLARFTITPRTDR